MRQKTSFSDIKKSIFPRIPSIFITSKKYRLSEKVLYEKDVKSIHDIMINHFLFWDDTLKIYYFCKDKIVDFIIRIEMKQPLTPEERSMMHKMSFHMIKTKHTIIEYLKYYQQWRQNDGCFTGSSASSKCVAGHAHGWDAINRIFILESNLFNALTYSKKKKIFDEKRFTTKEIKSLVSKDHCILIFNKNPIHKWSARMIVLQLRSICQRWNHLYNFLKNENFRSAILKLITQIQYRVYVLIHNGSIHNDLSTNKMILNEGVLSEQFNGKIICTPQNNCGMSSLTSKGSWLENLILTCSRIITKIQNTIIMIDRLAPLSSCTYISDLSTSFLPKNWTIKVDELESMLYEKCLELLDTGQLQESLAKSLCPSLIGIDALVRVSDIFGSDRVSRVGYFEKSRNISPTGMCLWLDSYLKYQTKDYIFESPISNVLYDMKQITLLHAFELICKKDGNNPMGFIKEYFVRLECVKDDEDIVFKNWPQYNVPFVVKMGANYIVCRGGTPLAIYCGTICEALFVWALILKKFNRWKIDELNLKSIYKNIFKI